MNAATKAMLGFLYSGGVVLLALAVGVLVLGMASCTSPTAAIATQCLPMADYTGPQEKAIGDELAGLEAANPHDPVVGAMSDYTKLRAENRACLGAPPLSPAPAAALRGPADPDPLAPSGPESLPAGADALERAT
jgi:hypothetical protein